jgi:hypothetical protein
MLKEPERYFPSFPVAGDLSMLETLRELPAYYWLILTVVAVAAIYYLWGRKTTPTDKSE